jgi:chromosome segregation ATPase
MTTTNELDKRVTILEVELKNMSTSLNKLDKIIEENTEITFQIKEKLDKQNGAIPHLSEMIKQIATRQEQIADKLNTSIVGTLMYKTKTKVMWGMLAVIGISLTGIVLKSILG